MPFNFFSLPSEIRIKIYEELLVAAEIITVVFRYADTVAYDPFPIYGKGSRPSPNIILANKATHQEASPVLYSRNQFRLGLNTAENARNHTVEHTYIAGFVDYIGPSNASLVRHIHIIFPACDIHQHDAGRRAEITKISQSTLKLIQDKFTSIFSLGFFIHDDTVSTEELDIVHAHLRSIPSLKEVKAITYERLRTAKMVDEMKNKGWIVEFTGPSEWDILRTQGMFQGVYIGFDWDIDGGDYYL
jgi:hypothetical protein